MSPGRLEIGEEEGLREKQIKGTQVVRFCHVLERPVMKAIYIFWNTKAQAGSQTGKQKCIPCLVQVEAERCCC